MPLITQCFQHQWHQPIQPFTADRLHVLHCPAVTEGIQARIDLLRFQVSELDAAGLTDGDEDDRLAEEEALLGDAVAHREAAQAALSVLDADGPASDALTVALAGLTGRPPFGSHAERLVGLMAELGDLAGELRGVAERLEEDPDRLAAVSERRRLLAELRRKYGEHLASVMVYHAEAAGRLAGLEDHEAIAAALDARRIAAEAARTVAAAALREARLRAAPVLAARIQEHLRVLAMATATVEVTVDGEAGGDVVLCLSPNSGTPMLPVARVASGGELARTMLAVGLVLTASPPVQVFDEVDAEAAAAADDLRVRTNELGGLERDAMFAHVYSDPHPLMDEQRRWLAEDEASFEGGTR